MWSSEVQFKDDSGGGSLRMEYMEAERKGTVEAVGCAALTLMPSFDNLRFTVRMSLYGGSCGSLINGLDYFASLQNVSVVIECGGATAAEVQEVEAALRRTVDVHPNRPILTCSGFKLTNPKRYVCMYNQMYFHSSSSTHSSCQSRGKR